MVRGLYIDDAMIAHAVAFILSCFAITLGLPLWALGLLVIGAIAVVAMADAGRRPGMSAMGVFLIGASAGALIWMRSGPDLGFEAVLFVMLCVWATDTFAMLAGKAIGGPLLYPSVSPKKTWAGALGGLLAAALTGGVFVSVLVGGDWTHGLAMGASLSCAAQIGDLFESSAKRICNVKNTSELIPGHGGVLDRMDGLIGAALAAVALGALMNADHPVRGLLLGE